MNRNLLLPLLLIILLGGTAFLYLSDKESKKTEEGDWVMHIEDTETIHKIFIADRKGGKATLTRGDKYWQYNNKFNANPNVMANVLNTLQKIRLKNRPAAAAIPNMVKTLSTQSIKVVAYDKNDKILKSFYVGGVTPDERGTFMIMEGSDNPYVMHIPLTEVSLKQRFFTEEIKWRDKTIFEYNPKDILSVSIEYPRRKNKSFTLERHKGSWKIDPFYPTTRRIEKEINQDLIESYLKGFRKVGAETFEDRPKFIKNESNQKEFCIIRLVLKDASQEEVHFYPIQRYEDEENTKPFPVSRYLTINSKKDTYLTQHLVFKEIFWGYEFFFEG